MSHRLSIVLSVQAATFSALTYQGNLAANLARIKALGYDGVEVAIRDPETIDRHELFAALDATGLPVPAIGTGQAYGEEGLCFVHEDKTVREKAIARIRAHVPLAQQWNAIIIIGLIRGARLNALSRQAAEEYLESALRETAGRHPDVRFAIEPINRYETELICNVESGLRFLDRLRLENVGLLLDTFHMNIEEPSLAASITAAAGRVFHFHVADSNRWHPGAGHIDFRAVFAALERIGYQGFVSAEILPLPDGDSAARDTIAHLRKLRP